MIHTSIPSPWSVGLVEAGQHRRARAPGHRAEELRSSRAVRRRHRGGRISRLM